ncbi:PaREP1 family protein [Acidianus sp. RZ1]|uniref:PaREP1 family protein n=1 Tax=Acidianus sp. RZ1 TaxID=1540082 RepID=UPI0014909D27|nr:PaREP1 family protein [Acidianus sp. RZ1]NON63151.1 superfamily I DNA and RNA helicase and helicaseubunit [Acidianus sp. RZ1]
MRPSNDDLQKLLKEIKEELSTSDPIQASEKLYKVAEECVKTLAIKYNVKIKVRKDQYVDASLIESWSSYMLFQAVEKLSNILGKDLEEGWNTAWELHLRGFHENELTTDEILDRIVDVQKLLAFCGLI